MARILAAISDLLSKRTVTPVSYNDRLIVSDYSDIEMEQGKVHNFDGTRPLSITYERDAHITPSPENTEFDVPIEMPSDIQMYRNMEVPAVRTRNYLNSHNGSFVNDLIKIAENNLRTKPVYADCWLVGKKDDLEKITEYETPSGKVMIGSAVDGETEYNLTPNEYSYPDSLNAIVENTIGKVREMYRTKGGRMDRQSVTSLARGMLMDSSDTLEAIYGSDACQLDTVISEICDTVYRYTVGLGVFDILLADPKLEDIYIDAPCEKNRIHVTMNGIDGVNSHIRCRTNLTVDKKEVMNLINVLKRESGLQFCESNPILETDMSLQDARATVVGYPMSPNGDAVAIRKHSVRPWTLTRLIANGTVDPKIAGLLSFLVDNRATFLICGSRGAGKSSLLSALMFEFPISQRILTIEDTMELPGSKMRKMGYKVQSMLIDDRMDGDNLSRADEALRVSLRMGESAIVLGEVRGEEAKTLYQSMRTGRAGSSIMGTIHGDSARSVYERVVHDMNIAPEAFMATDILVTLGTIRDRRTGNQIRKLNEIVATATKTGEFMDITESNELFSSPVMHRVMASSQMSKPEIMKEIRARALIRAYLAEVGKRYGDEYHGPEWIGVSNDHVSRSRGGTAEEVLESFKVKFQKLTGVGVQ
ncbi:MAG: type II/IV secretion system ATPase subunit [Candidatus Methanoplasma sp.]|jgi:type IV secretory pathway ATPase VirB11/archaellum biosynthesis ATPase|nr:type II/IV secretion system ATPase subunit [Candidatus Methanoplasma sp.]